MIKYFYAFLAILLLGNIADVPVMFLGVRGELSLYFVFIAGFLTDIFSDILWYWLGGKMGLERFEKMWFFKKKIPRIDAIGRALDKYGMSILFFSKFIPSLGVPTQLVAGAHQYPVKKMMLANILGAGSLLLVVYSLAQIFNSEVVARKFLREVDIALVLFLATVILLHSLISKVMNRILNSKNRVESDASSNRNV